MKQNLFSDDAVRLDILRQRSYSMRWASLPEDVIPLSSADPDFPPSQEILDTLHEYLNGGYMPYVPPLGITGLRETLAEGIWKRKHEKTEPNGSFRRTARRAPCRLLRRPSLRPATKPSSLIRLT